MRLVESPPGCPARGRTPLDAGTVIEPFTYIPQGLSEKHVLFVRGTKGGGWDEASYMFLTLTIFYPPRKLGVCPDEANAKPAQK